MCLVANILCDNAKELALGSPENGKKLLLEKSSKMRQMALDFQNLVPSTDQNQGPRGLRFTLSQLHIRFHT